MFSDPMTLYKLMILYMLNQVNFPITNNHITYFFLSLQYTSYHTLQQALSELKDSDLIYMETTNNTSRYDITSDGEETLNCFKKQISPAIIDDINTYISENKFKLRNDANTLANYYTTDKGEHMIHCEVREGDSTLISLDVNVPDIDQAKTMCDNWKHRSQDIYQYALLKLM